MKIDLTYSDYLKMSEEKKLPEIPPPESSDCVVTRENGKIIYCL